MGLLAIYLWVLRCGVGDLKWLMSLLHIRGLHTYLASDSIGKIYGHSWQPKRPSNINQKYVITNIYLKNWRKLIFKGSIQRPIKITNASETQWGWQVQTCLLSGFESLALRGVLRGRGNVCCPIGSEVLVKEASSFRGHSTWLSPLSFDF